MRADQAAGGGELGVRLVTVIHGFEVAVQHVAQCISVGRVRLASEGGGTEGGLAVLGQRAFERLGGALVIEQQRLVERSHELLQHARPHTQPVPHGEGCAQAADVPCAIAQRQQRGQLLGDDDAPLGQLQRVAQQDGWPAAVDDRVGGDGA